MSTEPHHTTAPKLTNRQAEAVAKLTEYWTGFGSGPGWVNVSLRGLLYRAPDFLEMKRDEDGQELWRLK